MTWGLFWSLHRPGGLGLRLTAYLEHGNALGREGWRWWVWYTWVLADCNKVNSCHSQCLQSAQASTVRLTKCTMGPKQKDTQANETHNMWRKLKVKCVCVCVLKLHSICILSESVCFYLTGEIIMPWGSSVVTVCRRVGEGRAGWISRSQLYTIQ